MITKVSYARLYNLGKFTRTSASRPRPRLS